MAIEIERKFLVSGNGWREGVTRWHAYRQFYLARTERSVTRVRIIDDIEARLTVKGKGNGLSRDEFEWPIPVEDARGMETLAVGRVIAKIRHHVPAGDHLWEVDVFEDGLILAEIELSSEGESFIRPDWLGRDVTGDPAYYNATMALGELAERPENDAVTSGV